MKWKDDDIPEEGQEENEGDYYDEEEYSPWRKGNGVGVGSAMAAIIESPLVWIGVGAVVVVLLVLIFMPKKETEALSSRQAEQLLMRIERLEEQYRQLAPLMEKIATTEGQQNRTKELARRLDRFEKQVERSFAQIDGQLARLRPGGKSRPAGDAPPAAARPAPAADAPGGLTHTVAGGDTLYGLSKRYDVPIDTLRKLNNLGPQDPIKPGQTLVIRK
jgi:LysM repeat protein